MDRNGYEPSRFNTQDGKCFICHKRGQTVRHEVFFGVGNRKLSKKHGMWVNICPECHSKIHSHVPIHDNVDADLQLKAMGQYAFEKYHSREEFMKLFGRNWL